MVSVILEGLWMFSDRIVDFQFFVKFHRSGPAIIFSFWTIMEHVSCASKKLLIKTRFIRTSSRWSVLLWKDYGCFLIEFSIFNFGQISQVRTCNNFQFLNYHDHVSYGSKKLLIKPRFVRTSSRWWVLLWKNYGWFLIKLSIFDFSSNFTGPAGPAIIFSFWTITKHVNHSSKKLLIKPRFIRTSSRWSVLFWKDYGCFLIELSIFNFSSNFTGPDLQ